jgi:hypothetical protein
MDCGGWTGLLEVDGEEREGEQVEARKYKFDLGYPY